MSKKQTESLTAQESGPRDTGKHDRPSKGSGSHLTGKHPELKNAKGEGKHGSRKTNHPAATRKLENFPQYTKGSDVKLDPAGGNSSLTTL